MNSECNVQCWMGCHVSLQKVKEETVSLWGFTNSQVCATIVSILSISIHINQRTLFCRPKCLSSVCTVAMVVAKYNKYVMLAKGVTRN